MEIDESMAEARTYYTYKITASNSDKYYYGVSHVKIENASQEDCEIHSYMGSGGVKFSNWKIRHHSNLQKEALATFKTREEAFEAEERLVGDLYRVDPLCLNSTTGGKYAGPVVVGVNLRECTVHGFVAHNESNCYSCLADNRYTLKECSIHGLTKHSGESCSTCVNRGAFSERNCHIHGLTIFRGNSCRRCSQAAAVIVQECTIHGLVKHIGDVCYSCISLNAEVYTQMECEIHGEVIFRGDSCATCSAQSAITMQDCSIHGLAKHKRGKCCTCLALEGVSEMDCSIHGIVKIQGGLCSRCEGSKRFYPGVCEIHGESKHRTSSKSCVRCESAARNVLRDCVIHGEAPHQSSSCVRCVVERGIHTREHVKKNKFQASCSHCVERGLSADI